MRALIFGANGQDGIYLREHLESKDIEVIGASRSNSSYQGSVSDKSFVSQLVKDLKPDFIFHLAANSTTKHDCLQENHETISTGTIHILESVKTYAPYSKVFLSGSALQFENNGRPINEKTPFVASSSYAASRIASVYMGRYFREAFETQVYVGYFFNHDSPLRSNRHVNKKIAQAAKDIKRGLTQKLQIGDISVKKEFNHAKDIVRAIWTLVGQNSTFETVIGSGVAYSIEDWIEICFSKVHLNWRNHVVIDPNFKPEYSCLVSDPTIIKSLGWEPIFSIKDLADEMMKDL